MKRLKPATMKRYTERQLMRHLDRLQDQTALNYECSPFRIDHAFGAIYEARQNNDGGTSYLFYCSDQNREDIINAIESTYRTIGI